MAFSATITLTTAGADTGPFDLYSDADGYTAAFETGVLKVDLEAGYTSVLVPDGSSIIRVKSTATCTNYVDLPIAGVTTTTTSTTTAYAGTITISACATVRANGSGFVNMYVYATAGVATPVTVSLRWTGNVGGSTVDHDVILSTGTACQSVSVGGITPLEVGTGLQIMSINPVSFGTQNYAAGTASLSDTCLDCGIA